MPDLPRAHTPPGATPARGFTPDPHHERRLKSAASSGDGVRALELAVQFAHGKERTAAELIADAEAFLAFLQKVRG